MTAFHFLTSDFFSVKNFPMIFWGMHYWRGKSSICAQAHGNLTHESMPERVSDALS